MRPESGARIQAATEADRPVVANLLQLYLHDLAGATGFPIGRDGRYAYTFLDRFWQHPHLVFEGRDLAGFALVIEGCPLTDTPGAWFMAEFFILRAHRRRGVGRAAVTALLGHHRGPWHIAAQRGNAPALGFWPGVLPGASATDLTAAGDAWRLFRLRPDRTGSAVS